MLPLLLRSVYVLNELRLISHYSAGGRFPSDLQVPRNAPLSPSSGTSSDPAENEAGVIAAAGAIPGSSQHEYHREGEDPYRMRGVSSGTAAMPSNSYDDDAERYMAHPQERNIANDAPMQQQQPAQQYPQSNALPNVAAYNPPTQQQPISQQQQQYTQQQQQSYQQPPSAHQPQSKQPQKTAFLGGEPATQQEALANNRPSSMYGDWMAPAAAGVAGVGAGALGAEAYRNHHENQQMPATDETTEAYSDDQEGTQYQQIPGTDVTVPVVPAKSERRRSSPPANPVAPEPHVPNSTAYDTNRDSIPSSSGGMSTSTAPTEVSTSSGLGGLESKGAHETGHIFPRVVRHDTNMSISALHVPGEFPRRD